MTYRFIPPSGTHDAIIDRDTQMFKEVSYGFTVIKDNAASCSYRQVRDPSQIELAAAAVYYLGTHVYFVTDAEAACLASAGYGDYLTFLGPDGNEGVFSDVYTDSYGGVY